MFHVMFNAYWEPLVFELPAPGRPERRALATMDRHLSRCAR